MLDNVNVTPLGKPPKLKSMVVTQVDQHVGAKVRARRLSLGLSLDALAELSRATKVELGAFERGERRPSAVALIGLSTALEVRLSYFFEDLA